MNANRTALGDNPSTPAAGLGGIGRVHGNDLNTGAFSLVFKHLPNQLKASIMRGQGQTSIAVNEAEGEIFDRDQVIFCHKSTADLVQTIRSLIGNLF